MRARSTSLAVALIVAAVAGSACGKRGDPLPPIRPVPGRIADLIARRIDDRVELRFTVPATNNDGTTPSRIDRIEVYRTMSTEDATFPSAVVLLNKKNLIGEITVRRPPAPAPQSTKGKNGAAPDQAAVEKKDTAPAPPAAPPGPGPGELAIYVDTTPTDTMPASMMRHYMLIGWAGNQQQRSGRVDVSMEPFAPPRPIEDLTADFDATAIKVTWVGPPLLFLPTMRPGSPLPVGYMTPARPTPGQWPVATMPKMPAFAPGVGATGTAGTGVPGSTALPPTFRSPPPTLPTGQSTPPPSRTGGTTAGTTSTTTTTTTTTPPVTTGTTGTTGRTPVPPGGAVPDQTRGTFGTAPAGGSPVTAPGMTPGLGAPAGAFGAPAAAGPVRGYRVTEVDESGHELTPNGPLAPVTPVSQLTLPVVFDKTRCFVVRTVDTLPGSVLMESPASTAVCVTPKDTFPPPAPTELRAFGSETGVVLTWTGVEAPDLAGYVVLRGEGAGDNMQPLNTTPMTDTTFSDTTVKSGVTYVYAVIAVDSSPQHNPSAQSNKQTIVARQP